MKNLQTISELLRCSVGEWAFFKVIKLFPTASHEQYACALAYKTYIETMQAGTQVRPAGSTMAELSPWLSQAQSTK